MSLREQIKEAFSRYHRGDHSDVILIEHDVMLALERAERTRREMPCFCGTRDAYRCPAAWLVMPHQIPLPRDLRGARCGLYHTGSSAGTRARQTAGRDPEYD